LKEAESLIKEQNESEATDKTGYVTGRITGATDRNRRNDGQESNIYISFS